MTFSMKRFTSVGSLRKRDFCRRIVSNGVFLAYCQRRRDHYVLSATANCRRVVSDGVLLAYSQRILDVLSANCQRIVSGGIV